MRHTSWKHEACQTHTQTQTHTHTHRYPQPHEHEQDAKQTHTLMNTPLSRSDPFWKHKHTRNIPGKHTHDTHDKHTPTQHHTHRHPQHHTHRHKHTQPETHSWTTHTPCKLWHVQLCSHIEWDILKTRHVQLVGQVSFHTQSRRKKTQTRKLQQLRNIWKTYRKTSNTWNDWRIITKWFTERMNKHMHRTNSKTCENKTISHAEHTTPTFLRKWHNKKTNHGGQKSEKNEKSWKQKSTKNRITKRNENQNMNH